MSGDTRPLVHLRNAVRWMDGVVFTVQSIAVKNIGCVRDDCNLEATVCSNETVNYFLNYNQSHFKTSSFHFHLQLSNYKKCSTRKYIASSLLPLRSIRTLLEAWIHGQARSKLVADFWAYSIRDLKIFTDLEPIDFGP